MILGRRRLGRFQLVRKFPFNVLFQTTVQSHSNDRSRSPPPLRIALDTPLVFAFALSVGVSYLYPITGCVLSLYETRTHKVTLSQRSFIMVTNTERGVAPKPLELMLNSIVFRRAGLSLCSRVRERVRAGLREEMKDKWG